jgi:hypothetical protein
VKRIHVAEHGANDWVHVLLRNSIQFCWHARFPIPAAKVALECRAPWDKAEPEAIIDHRESARGEINALAVDARDGLTFHCR